jgi:hypothetical protein
MRQPSELQGFGPGRSANGPSGVLIPRWHDLMPVLNDAAGGGELLEHGVHERHGKSCAQKVVATLSLDHGPHSIFQLTRSQEVEDACRTIRSAHPFEHGDAA